MGLPQQLGGGGAGLLELALVAEQFGRRIAPVPFVESAAAARLLARFGASDLVAGVVDGGMVTTLALTPVSGGSARVLPAGAVAGVAVVLDGDALVALRRSVGGAPTTPLANFGDSPLADWDLASFDRTVLASGSWARELHAGAGIQHPDVLSARKGLAAGSWRPAT
jgi:hypothetical protein